MSPRSRSVLLATLVASLLAAPVPVQARPDGPVTRVTGWSTTALEVQHGEAVDLRSRVRVGRAASPGRRVVLEARAGASGRWQVMAKDRSDTRGRVDLTWVAPAVDGELVLRLRVAPGTRTSRAITASRRVQVSGASSGDVPTSSTPGSTPPPASSATQDYRAELVRLVNDARSRARSCGSQAFPAVPALSVDPRVDATAQDHATAMATQNFYSHTGPDGSDPGTRLTAHGYAWRTYGENIAAGYRTPAEVMAGWLASPGHCANLMSASFVHLGVGYAAVDGSSYGGTRWVQVFAAPRG